MVAIKADSFVIPLMGVNGNIVAHEVSAPKNEDELVIPAVATDKTLVGMRVVSMQKQDEVGLPGIACDNVAVAIKGGQPALGMIMVFIDEAQSIYYPDGQAAWDADVVRWNHLVAEYGPPEYAAVYKVSGQELGIIPENRSCPDEIQYRTISRNPSLSEMITAYNNCKGGEDRAHPQDVVLCVDVSGSMTRSDMTPGIDLFEQWLSDQDPPVPWTEQSFGSERWLALIDDWYEQYRQQQQ